jgi:hypothetical protein
MGVHKGSPINCNLRIYNPTTGVFSILVLAGLLKTHNELDINHIKSQTIGYYFYHMFTNLYLLFVNIIVQTVTSPNFTPLHFVKKKSKKK